MKRQEIGRQGGADSHGHGDPSGKCYHVEFQPLQICQLGCVTISKLLRHGNEIIGI